MNLWFSVFHLVLLATALPVSTGAQSEPGQARAFELLSDRTPKLLFVGRDVRVPLELENRGSLTWSEADRFFVSYAWNSRAGEKVEGSRGHRTRLAEIVKPGQKISVLAILKPPKRVGVYRLRWDVVQEQVQWFSHAASHPKFDRRVVILPRVEYWLGFVLPSLLAVIGLLLQKWSGRRATSSFWYKFSAWVVVLWATVSIAVKPQFLYAQMDLGLGSKAFVVNLTVMAIVLLIARFMPFRWRSGVSWLMVAASAFMVWSHLLHFRFFRDVISVASLPAIGQAGWLGGVVDYLAKPSDAMLVVDLIIAIPLVWMTTRMSEPIWKSKRWIAGVVTSLLILLAAGGIAHMWRLSNWTGQGRGPRVRTVRTVQKYGLYGYQIRDVLTQVRNRMFRPSLGEEQGLAVERWFRDRAAYRAGTGPLFGIARDMNLIAIQVESAQQLIIGLKIDGKEITPNLNRWSETALSFTQVQDQTGNGRSSAGEFVTWTSIVPIATSVAHEYPSNEFVTPAHVMGEQGYHVVSAVPFARSFWNRHQTYPAYGFHNNLFAADFEPGQEVGWGLSDRDFFRQMVPRILALPEPFLVWMTTLSLHYPYEEFPDLLKSLDLGELEDTPFGNYLHGMRYFDEAFGELMTKLEIEGVLENTVVALWGDHDSGLIRRKGSPDVLGITQKWPKFFAMDRVPFLISLPGADANPDLKAARIDSAAGQVDIAPTLLALFGHDPAKLPYLGRNLLGDGASGEPVVHPNGNWITDTQLFLDTGEDLRGGACWDLRRKRKVTPDQCSDGYSRAQTQLDMSETILIFDLQRSLSLDLTRGD